MKDDVNEVQECQCQTKSKDKYDEIFSKWQFKQIDYLTFNINLIFGGQIKGQKASIFQVYAAGV